MSARSPSPSRPAPRSLPDAAPLRSGLSLQAAGEFRLESGEVLEDVVQAYRVEGRLNAARDNLVLLFHSLTGSPSDFGGWEPFVGPGRALDTRRLCVVAPNLLGSCYGTRYSRRKKGSRRPPAVTTRDMARLAARLLDRLGVGRAALVAGGSLGGMVALELAATLPERAAAAAVFAAPAAPCAWGSGWNHVHREAVKVAGLRGLALARMVGMLTYRTPGEVEGRFGSAAPDSAAPAAAPAEPSVRGYLTHHGEKLVRRFSASSYLALLDAMDSHDVGRGRGGVAAALSAFAGRLTAVGIPGDLLYPPEVVKGWATATGAEYHELASSHGHDAFLIEPSVGRLLSELASARAGGPALPRPPRAAYSYRSASIGSRREARRAG